MQALVVRDTPKLSASRVTDQVPAAFTSVTSEVHCLTVHRVGKREKRAAGQDRHHRV